MKVTIIKADGVVGVEGIFLPVNTGDLPSDLRVLQWYGSYGYEEWTNKANTRISSLSGYQVYIDRWDVVKTERHEKENNKYYGMSLNQIRSSVWEDIKRERDKRKDGGFKVNGWWFHSDQPSRVQHLGLVMLGASLPGGIMWKTMSGSFVELTPAVVSQIFASGLQLDTALFTQAEIHRAAMEASSDPEAYDYHTGWPENFLGL